MSSFYFVDFRGNRHYANTRDEAEQVRQQVGGGYVVYELQNLKPKVPIVPIAGSSTRPESARRDEGAEPTQDPQENAIRFFLQEHGKIGLLCTATRKTASLLYMLLSHEAAEGDIGNCTVAMQEWLIIFRPAVSRLTTIRGSVSARAAQMIWNFCKLLPLSVSYSDPWEVARDHPFEEWRLWAQGIDPAAHEVSHAENLAINCIREGDAAGWECLDESFPGESLDDTERNIGAISIAEEEWSYPSYDIPEEDEALLKQDLENHGNEEWFEGSMNQWENSCVIYEIEYDDDPVYDYSEGGHLGDEWLEADDLGDEILDCWPDGYDGLDAEYWNAAGQNADPDNHWGD